MSTSALSGSGSVIDVRGIVKQLMEFEARPLAAARKRVSAVDVSISAMSEIRSVVDKAAASSKAIEDSMMLSGKSVKSSDATLIPATVSNAALASAGSYTVSNTVVGKVQRTAFAGFADATTTTFGSGLLEITGISSDFGSVTDQSFDLGGKTLEQLRDEINSDADLTGLITASIVNTMDGSNNYVLLISGTKTGSTAIFTPTMTGQTASALDSASPPGLSQAASNASAVVNGITVYSKENMFTEAIGGLSFSITKTDATSSTTLTVTDNRSTLKDRLKTFAADLTNLNQKLATLTKPGSKSQKAGPLSGNSAILSLGLALSVKYSEGFRITAGSGSGNTYTWSELGLEVNRDGSVTVRDADLSTAIDGVTSRSGVDKRIGVEMLSGFTSAIRQTLDSFRGVSGTVQSSIDILNTSRSRLSANADDIERKLERTQKSLLMKYSALDSKLASMNQLGSNLRASLAGLSA
jgi:flagellar hook-associated protein 2